MLPGSTPSKVTIPIKLNSTEVEYVPSSRRTKIEIPLLKNTSISSVSDIRAKDTVSQSRKIDLAWIWLALSVVRISTGSIELHGIIIEAPIVIPKVIWLIGTALVKLQIQQVVLTGTDGIRISDIKGTQGNTQKTIRGTAE